MIEPLPQRYRVISTLGQGGMGTVYRVEDTQAGREVAVKVLSVADDGGEALLGFRQEFRTMARLRHPNAVEVYDFGETQGGRAFYSMEIVDGLGLDERLPYAPEVVRDVLIQSLRVLGFLHRQGQVHLDIKPENLRLTPEGVVKLMDFGLMVDVGTSGTSIRGTLAYMAPEVARRGKLDGRADLYSLGAVAFHLLSGSVPFPGEDPVQVLKAHQETPPPPLADDGSLPGDLIQLIEHLLQKDPRHRPQSASEALAVLGIQTEDERLTQLLGSPLVGRGAELERMETALSGLDAGQGSVITLSGEQGLGKSRLIDEFRFQVQLAGWPYLAGRGRGPSVPYGPFAELLKALVTLVPEDILSPHRPILSRLLPGLAESGGPDLDPDEEQVRLRTAFAELLGHAASGGVVVVLDDWHEADELSKRLFDHLVRRLEDGRAVVILAGQRMAGRGEVVELGALSEDAVGEMVKAMLGTEAVEPEFIRSFHGLTDGHPLFAEASLQLLLEQDLLVRREGAWTTREPLTAKHLPSSVQDLLRGQLAALSSPARDLLLVMALVGEPVTLGLLGRITGLAGEELLERVEPLRAQGIVVQDGDLLRFVQSQFMPLLRDEYSSGAEAWHQKIAEALLAQAGGDPEAVREAKTAAQIARHFLTAGTDPRRPIMALVAGEENLKLFALSVAKEFLVAGHALLHESEKSLALRYLTALATVERYQNLTVEALGHAKEAIVLAEGLGRKAEASNLLTSVAILHQIRAEYAEGLAAVERAEELAKSADSVKEWLRALKTASRIYYKRTDIVHAIETCRRALPLADRAGGPHDVSAHQAFLGFLHVTNEVPGLSTRDRIDLGVRYLEQAASFRRSSLDRVGLADSLNLLGNALWQLGRFGEATRAFRENLDLTIELGVSNDEVCAQINLAIQAEERGIAEELVAWAREAVRRAAEIDSADFGLIASHLLALGLILKGHLREALQVREDAAVLWERIPEGGRVFVELNILPYKAQGDLVLGRFHEALKASDRAWEHTETTGVREFEQRILVLQGEAMVRLGEAESAKPLALRALELGEEVGSPVTVARASFVLALVAWAAGQPDEAIERLEEAWQAAESCGALGVARDVAEQGVAQWVARGDRKSAKPWLDRLESLGDHLVEPDAQARLQLARARVAGRSETGGRALQAASRLLQEVARDQDPDLFEDYRSLDVRWAIHRADPTLPAFLDGGAQEAAVGGADVQRRYLLALQENRALQAELESVTQARDQLETVVDFSRQTSRESNLNDLLHQIMDQIGRIVEADRGFLLLADRDDEGNLLLRPKATYNISSNDRRPQTWKRPESLARTVFDSGETMYIPDVRDGQAPESTRSVLDLNVRTVLCVPLPSLERTAEANGPAIGVIYLDRQAINNSFQDRDLKLVETLALQASQAIEKARLYSSVADKAQKLEHLNDLAKVASTTLELRSVLDVVVHKTLQHTNAERAFIFLKGSDGGLVCERAMDRHGGDIEHQHDQVSMSVTTSVLQTGEPACLRDTRNNTVFQAQKSILDLDLRTVMCVPLRRPQPPQQTTRVHDQDKRQRGSRTETRAPREEYVGVLYVDSKVVVEEFTDKDLALLESIASLASSAIYNAQMYKRATEDALTGLFFRSYLETRMEEEAHRAQRTGGSLSILLSDIDHFKRFNDTYGHAVGDDVLRHVAQTIRRTVREDDIASRFGGEEMVVLMPDTGTAGAAVLAERLRASIEGNPLPGSDGQPLRVTVSIGHATLLPGEDPKHMLERADLAMYRSKHGGRNRVSAAEEQAEVEPGSPIPGSG
ncbi:MAG: diguanylate cyclase [Candidatus Sericytochromatia bacterium]|nr:diguanylate cyclase [Candidatus Sericytochromatia bacterium]